MKRPRIPQKIKNRVDFATRYAQQLDDQFGCQLCERSIEFHTPQQHWERAWEDLFWFEQTGEPKYRITLSSGFG